MNGFVLYFIGLFIVMMIEFVLLVLWALRNPYKYPQIDVRINVRDAEPCEYYICLSKWLQGHEQTDITALYEQMLKEWQEQKNRYRNKEEYYTAMSVTIQKKSYPCFTVGYYCGADFTDKAEVVKEEQFTLNEMLQMWEIANGACRSS